MRVNLLFLELSSNSTSHRNDIHPLGQLLNRGVHRVGSLTCSEMVIKVITKLPNSEYGVFLFGMFLCLSVVTKIIPKRLSVLPVYCDWSLLIY